MSHSVAVIALVLAMTGTAFAQQKEPIGRWVADARIVSAGLPNEPGWTPTVPASTVVPSRGFGFEVGAHLNVLRGRSVALGVGATWLVARGTSTPPENEGGAPAAGVPEVQTRLTALTPQLSLNFGHSLGWSYLSAGLGRSKTESEASLGATFVPRASDWVKTLNYGGGARWFLSERVGVGFDIRWHKVSIVAARADHPGAPRASLLVAGAGVVLK